MITQYDSKASEKEIVSISSYIQHALYCSEGILVGSHRPIEFHKIFFVLEYAKFLNSKQVLKHIAECIDIEVPKDSLEGSLIWLEEWMLEWVQASFQSDWLSTAWRDEKTSLEAEFLSGIQSTTSQLPLRLLDPTAWTLAGPWTPILQGRRICLVTHAPIQDLALRKSVFMYAANVSQVDCPSVLTSSWTEQCDEVLSEIQNTGSDLVLLGGGPYAMPLGARLKLKRFAVIVIGATLEKILETPSVLKSVSYKHLALPLK